MVRVHAVALTAAGPAQRAACGYQPSEGEVRVDRRWETVTVSGRCQLCVAHLRQQQAPAAVDVNDSRDPCVEEAIQLSGDVTDLRASTYRKARSSGA